MKRDGQPVDADRDAPAGDPRAHDFLEGRPRAVRAAEENVSKAVSFRGYYVPRDQQADIRQEVMLQVWREIARVGPESIASFDAFVRSVAHRRCVDWLRGQRPSETIDPDHLDARTPIDLKLVSREKLDLARSIIGSLRPACRELFRLHAAQNLSYRQIARRQNRSEGAVRVQMSTCLKQARGKLQRLRARAELRRRGS